MHPQVDILAPHKLSVLGIGISTTSYGEVVSLCRHWIRERVRQSTAHYICVTSVHGIVTALKNPSAEAALNGASIATPDGMPVVWALRSFGARRQNRVYGPDLMLELCRDAADCGHRIYLYGATNEVIAKLSSSLLAKFPKLIIAGSCAPPFRALTREEDEFAVHDILASQADLLFVGMSTPKQDFWMAEHAKQLPGVVLVGVGAAFLFHAGMVPQAPGWMQRRGLEWLFRLFMEPGRLWRRYLLETPVFLPLWALQKLRMFKFRLSGPAGHCD